MIKLYPSATSEDFARDDIKKIILLFLIIFLAHLVFQF